MKVQTIQPTPNPNAFKFLLDRQILAGTRDFASPDDARQDPLATAIFALPGVEGVFYCENFVTVSMTASADWRAVAEQVTGILESHYVEDQPAATANPTNATEPTKATETTDDSELVLPKGEDLELLQKINDLLDDRVRPALAGDGGGLEVLRLEGKTVLIRYQGACGSCPSSIQGTLMAIQNMLQQEVDEELAVVPA